MGTRSRYVLAFCLRLLDALHDRRPEVASALDALAAHVPADGRVPVTGGAEGETLRPLDIAPDPGRPSRALVDSAAVAADLRAPRRRPAGRRRLDRGLSPDLPRGVAGLAGIRTVKAIATLRRNGALG